MTDQDLPRTIILAAGEGSRLRPYTNDRPKCMVEVDGSSLLDRQLAVLGHAGLRDITIIGGYRAEAFGRYPHALRVNPDYASTNMVWTLFCAEDLLDHAFVLAYGDIVYAPEVLQAVLRSKADIAVAIDLDWEAYWRARNEDPLDDAETLRLADDGRILEIGQKPLSLVEIQGQYMGLMKFSAAGAQSLRQAYGRAREAGTLAGKTVEKAYMTDLLQALIDAGVRLDAVPVHGGWVEVDTVSDRDSPVTAARLAAIVRQLAMGEPDA